MKYLRDFAPYWQKKLDSNDKHPIYAIVMRSYGLEKKELNMNSFECCMVGEAHHFAGNYECPQCFEFSKLLNILYTKTLSRRFYEVVDELTMHMNLKHWVTIRLHPYTSKRLGITKEQI